MGRFSEGYNLLPDGRSVWLIQASDDAGWNWDEFFNALKFPYSWGGPEIIRSGVSQKRVREEFRPGDIAVCYQADPLKAVVGLARISSTGYSEHRRKTPASSCVFDLDWGGRVEPVPFEAIKRDRVLAAMEKARVRQGSVFRLSEREFHRMLALTFPIASAVAQVENVLRIVWPESDAPTHDDTELGRRVAALMKRGALPRPVGRPKPVAVVQNGVQVFARDPAVKAWVLQHAAGNCELCLSSAPFVAVAGEPFLETHHVRRLANNGSDTPENTVAVCPNCHRWLHLGVDSKAQVEKLYRQVQRLVPE